MEILSLSELPEFPTYPVLIHARFQNQPKILAPLPLNHPPQPILSFKRLFQAKHGPRPVVPQALRPLEPESQPKRSRRRATRSANRSRKSG